MLKIIDEKGRLFGKLNFIDFLVLLFIIFLLPIVYFGYALYIKKGNKKVLNLVRNEEPIGFVVVPCLFEGVTSQIYSKISIGDIEKNEKGESIGEVLWLGDAKLSNPYQYFGPSDHRYKLILANAPDLRHFFGLLRLKVFIHNKYAFYKSKKNVVKENSLIELKTTDYKLKCKVEGNYRRINSEKKNMEMKQIEKKKKEEKERNRRWLSIKVKFLVIPEVGNLMKKGDKGKKTDGTIISSLNAVTQLKTLEVTSSGNSTSFVRKISLKEILASLNIRCDTSRTDCYHRGQSLKVGNPFTFISDTYIARGNIVGMKF